jgi:hypothetical protein
MEFGMDWGAVAATPWVGLDSGYAHMLGVPTGGSLGHTQNGVWLGPDIGIDFVFGQRGVLPVTAGLATGDALVGVRGQVQGDRDVGVLGLWMALTLGLAISK